VLDCSTKIRERDILMSSQPHILGKISKLTLAEKRISTRLVHYWQALKGIREVPLESDIDPLQLKDIWSDCFLIQVNDIKRGRDYNYTILGENIVKAYGYDLDSEDTPPLVGPVADRLTSKFQEVILTKRPVRDEGQFLNRQNKLIKFRQVLVPFSMDGTNVFSVFGAMRYKSLDPRRWR
jgi:hypothetical protein